LSENKKETERTRGRKEKRKRESEDRERRRRKSNGRTSMAFMGTKALRAVRVCRAASLGSSGKLFRSQRLCAMQRFYLFGSMSRRRALWHRFGQDGR
jgi:hypothetical protein